MSWQFTFYLISSSALIYVAWKATKRFYDIGKKYVDIVDRYEKSVNQTWEMMEELLRERRKLNALKTHLLEIKSPAHKEFMKKIRKAKRELNLAPKDTKWMKDKEEP